MAAKSCSSFIIAGSETKTGDIIFAKNSDRPFNESQPLIYYPAQDYPEGTFTELLYKDPAGETYICMHRLKASFLLGIRARYQ